jgi:hypothetical protein
MRETASEPGVYRAFSYNRCRIAGVVAIAFTVVCVGGCSLLSFKSPEKPLSTRDMNIRVLTREYSVHFIAAVDQSADAVSATSDDPHLQAATLRWKIAATDQSLRAAMQIAPLMSLLDSWALAVQMKTFMQQGHPGGSLFGLHQAAVRLVADDQAERADALAQRLVEPKDLPRYQQFIDTYAREHPLENLRFARPSIVELWSRQTSADTKLVDSLGTIPEAMTDVANRLQMYGDTLPSEALWQAELALGDSGYSKKELHAAIEHLDDQLDRMASLADDTPQLVHGAVADVRKSLVTVIDRLNDTSAVMMASLHAERLALTADVQSEREAALVAVDQQRQALALDAAKISDQVVTTAGQEIRHLVREAVILGTLMAVILLGLPFAAGYLVGRARRHRSSQEM